MMRPQVPLLVLFVAATYLAPLDASPARILRAAAGEPPVTDEPQVDPNNVDRSVVEIIDIAQKENSLYKYSGIQVNVPIKPTIYTVNVDGLATFLGNQLSKVIKEQEEGKGKGTKPGPSGKRKRSLSNQLLDELEGAPKQYKVNVLLKISEVKDAEEDYVSAEYH